MQSRLCSMVLSALTITFPIRLSPERHSAITSRALQLSHEWQLHCSGMRYSHGPEAPLCFKSSELSGQTS